MTVKGQHDGWECGDWNVLYVESINGNILVWHIIYFIIGRNSVKYTKDFSVLFLTSVYDSPYNYFKIKHLIKIKNS